MTGTALPLHLLFPLFSSIVFVFGMLIGKRATSAGASPWTSTFLANFWLAIGWAAIGLARGSLLPIEAWPLAALVALSFVGGQMFTFLAFQYGDVSVATPVFGVKVIIVAILLALIGDEPVSFQVWTGAFLATLGVGVIQAGNRSPVAGRRSRMRSLATIVLALLSATSLSLFDIGLQLWGRRWGADAFLPATFVAGGVFSCGFLPWCTSPRQLRALGVLRPIITSTLFIAIQAVSMAYSLSNYGDATRINIVYALRGLWAVGLAWLLARAMNTAEAHLSRKVMFLRLLGAILLTLAVVVALMSS